MRVASAGDRDSKSIERIVGEDLRHSPLFELGDGVRIQVIARRLPGEVAASARIEGLPGGVRKLRFSGQSLRRQAHRLANGVQRIFLDGSAPFLSEVAFVTGTGAEPNSRQIFVVGYDGRGARRVSRSGRLNILPAWSRSGDLAFTSYARGAPVLMVVDAATRRARIMSSGGGLNVGAAFSPDGQSIALARSVGGNTDLYLLGRTGRLSRRLTRHAGIDVSPSWSPDGRQLVFVSDRSGSPQLYLMGVDDVSDKPRRLTTSGSYNQEPDWCGERGSAAVAYTRRYPGERYEIHLLDLRSMRDRRLTHGGAKSPSWSPDCRQLVYASEHRDRGGLWVTTPDGKQSYQLWRGRARSPAWSGYNDIDR